MRFGSEVMCFGTRKTQDDVVEKVGSVNAAKKTPNHFHFHRLSFLLILSPIGHPKG